MRNVLLVALAVLLVVSCTLLGDRDLVQCQQSSECPTARPQCIDGLCSAAGTAGDGGADADAAAMAADLCPFTYPADATAALADPNTVRVAAYANLGTTEHVSPEVATIRYALDDLAKVTTPQQLVVLFCRKDGPGPDRINAVLDHLVALHVPAVFGQLDTSELQTVGAAKGKIAILSTLGNDVALQPQSSGGSPVDWFLLPELKSLAPAFQKVFDREQAVYATAQDSTKVSVVTDGSPDATALADVVDQTIVLGAKKLVDIGERRQRTTVASAQDVVNFVPDVVIAIGGDAIGNTLIPVIEASNASRKPAYVLTSRVRYVEGGPFHDALGVHTSKPSLASRIGGIDYDGSGTRLVAFGVATNAISPYVLDFDVLFDAVYAVKLASIRARKSAGARALTAEDLSEGIRVLAPRADDTPVILTADGTAQPDFDGAVARADDGAPFQLSGISGVWNINGVTHSRIETDPSYFCIGHDNRILTYIGSPTGLDDFDYCTPINDQ